MTETAGICNLCRLHVPRHAASHPGRGRRGRQGSQAVATTDNRTGTIPALQLQLDWTGCAALQGDEWGSPATSLSGPDVVSTITQFSLETIKKTASRSRKRKACIDPY